MMKAMINVPKKKISEEMKVRTPTTGVGSAAIPEPGRRSAPFDERRGRAAASACTGWTRSQRGRGLRTGGRGCELWGGGGELVAHSSVQASQGFGPASRPWRRLR